MPTRYQPFGEDSKAPEGLIWWEVINERYQTEVQEGILGGVGNLLVFDIDNNDEILMNGVVVLPVGEPSEEDIQAWQDQAGTVIPN